jgi:hypothetical protein
MGDQDMKTGPNPTSEPMPPGALARRDEDMAPKAFGALLLSAGLGASVLGARAVSQAVRFAARGPAQAVATVCRVPILRARLRAFESVWVRERTQLLGVAGQQADQAVPWLAAQVLERLNLTQVVLERVDLNAVADRLDLDRVLQRMDLVTVARGLIDELDLPDIIRDSSGTMAVETLDELRVQSVRADLWLAGLMDRLLRRSLRSPEPLVVQPSDSPRDEGRVRR